MITPTHDAEVPGDRPGLRVAMALYGDVTHDSRVIREAETLSAHGHSVTVYCLSGAPAHPGGFRTVVVEPAGASVLPDGSSPFLGPAGASLPGRLMAQVRWTVGYARTVRAWGRAVVAAAGEVDVWHVHDLTGLLAVAPFAPRSDALVYDSHEIFLETGTAARLPATARRLLQKYERRLSQRAAALITVNDGCARVLGRRLRPRRVLVVRNCPPRWTPPAGGSRRLRDAAAIPADATVALYHGAMSRHRGIEELVAALREPGMEAVHAIFLGFGPLREELRATAGDPSSSGRVRVLDAVPPDQLLEWVVGADVAVMPVQRSTLNHWLASPNKLWEALAAGIPVVASDFPEMRRVVLADPEHPLGATCDPTSPASIARAIRAVTEQPAAGRDELRVRCLQAAHRRWNWETEADALVSLYRDLAGSAAPNGSPQEQQDEDSVEPAGGPRPVSPAAGQDRDRWRRRGRR